MDNDGIKDDEGLVEEDPTHPDLPSDIPGVDVEDECTEPGPIAEVEEVNDATMAATTLVNANLPGTIGVHSKITVVNVISEAI